MSQAGIPPTGFTAATPPNPSTGLQYSYQFVANGQPTPRYTLASGDLPDGLILSADGTLEGKATIATGYTFSIRATNAAGSVASPDITINVT
ncbi:MAG: putative Ig domain-containing protein [Solirubrobacteraceae bacterium]